MILRSGIMQKAPNNLSRRKAEGKGMIHHCEDLLVLMLDSTEEQHNAKAETSDEGKLDKEQTDNQLDSNARIFNRQI